MAIDRTCARPGCGKTFKAQRRSALYCGDSCRVKHRDQQQPVPEIRTNPRAVFRRLMARLGLPNPKRPSDLKWRRIDAVTWMLKKGRSAVTDSSPTESPSWHAIWSALLGRKRHTIDVSPDVLESYRLKPNLPHAKMMAESLLTGSIEEPVLAAHEDEDDTEMMERDVKAFTWLLGKRKPKGTEE